MPDNISVVGGVYTETIAADDLGGGVKAQRIKQVWGVDGTGIDVSAATPLPVVQTGVLPALPPGTNNIGDVDVLTLPPLPAGTNNIGDVDVLSLPPIPAGTNNIGDVDVLTLPALPAGTNNIGDVDVLTLPALPAGANVIGGVTQSGTWTSRTQDGTGTAIGSTAGALHMHIKASDVGGGGGGTEYTEGAVDATITGGAILWEDTGDTLRPVSATKPLPISVISSSVGATTATDSGTVTGGQAAESIVLALRHSFDGTNWTRAGATTSKTVSAATTNATSVKASAGVLYAVTCNNANAAVRYLKVYNKASAPTVGTDVPRLTLMLPAGGGFSENYAPTGLAFETGLAFALTVEATDAGATAVAAAEHVVHLHYK